ncbi:MULTISPECIES: hypothetical protein [unclassified Legionella]|uniref:hypothetical protein n=1 Tax=unclassified Legionella TaxID=2622702 RepID=UPI00105662E4|nr:MULTISPECIES: hypothetical protein [unclassified Legionella]MDI9818385.1 hypothetical protein [Legionella sp. PL877]
MNELDVLLLFYDEMKSQGLNRDKLFLSMDESALKLLEEKYGKTATLKQLHWYTDICLANEWLERTTIDPGYNFLSLTDSGLQIAIVHRYRP